MSISQRRDNCLGGCRINSRANCYITLSDYWKAGEWSANNAMEGSQVRLRKIKLHTVAMIREFWLPRLGFSISPCGLRHAKHVTIVSEGWGRVGGRLGLINTLQHTSDMQGCWWLIQQISVDIITLSWGSRYRCVFWHENNWSKVRRDGVIISQYHSITLIVHSSHVILAPLSTVKPAGDNPPQYCY